MGTGERIKELRISKGLTQEELGDKVGVKKAAIQKYESGTVENIKRSTIQKLADVLEVSPLYILDFQDVPTIEATETELTKSEQAHISKYRFIDDKGKHTVDTVLDMEYSRCTNVVPFIKETPKKKYEPTEDDIKSLVARNGKTLTREQAIDLISTLFSDDEDEE